MPPPLPPDSKSAMNEIFFGPNGLRAGWRLLIFGAIIAAFLTALHYGGKLLSHGQPPQRGFSMTSIIVGEAVVFLLFLFASWIMAKIEGRTIGDYGLPGRKAFQKEFWQGAIIGFVAMTILLGSLRSARCFLFWDVRAGRRGAGEVRSALGRCVLAGRIHGGIFSAWLCIVHVDDRNRLLACGYTAVDCVWRAALGKQQRRLGGRAGGRVRGISLLPDSAAHGGFVDGHRVSCGLGLGGDVFLRSAG